MATDDTIQGHVAWLRQNMTGVLLLGEQHRATPLTTPAAHLNTQESLHCRTKPHLTTCNAGNTKTHTDDGAPRNTRLGTTLQDSHRLLLKTPKSATSYHNPFTGHRQAARSGVKPTSTGSIKDRFPTSKPESKTEPPGHKLQLRAGDRLHHKCRDAGPLYSRSILASVQPCLAP